MTDPTATAVAKEIKSENVNLSNRYWEATPPQIAVPVASALSKFILNPNLTLTPFLKSLQTNCPVLLVNGKESERRPIARTPWRYACSCRRQRCPARITRAVDGLGPAADSQSR